MKETLNHNACNDSILSLVTNDTQIADQCGEPSTKINEMTVNIASKVLVAKTVKGKEKSVKVLSKNINRNRAGCRKVKITL